MSQLRTDYTQITSAGVGAVTPSTTAVPTLTAQEFGNSLLHSTVITLNNHVITLADEAGVVAYGGSKIYSFPAGTILSFAGGADLTFTKTSAGVNNDFDGDFGVGTITASNNSTLSGNEQNIIASTATPQAVAGVTSVKVIQPTWQTLGPVAATTDVYLNVLVDDADHNVTATACNFLVSGTLTLFWTRSPITL